MNKAVILLELLEKSKYVQRAPRTFNVTITLESDDLSDYDQLHYQNWMIDQSPEHIEVPLEVTADYYGPDISKGKRGQWRIENIVFGKDFTFKGLQYSKGELFDWSLVEYIKPFSDMPNPDQREIEFHTWLQKELS